MVCSCFVVLRIFSVVFLFFHCYENKGLKVLALKPGDILVSPTKTLFTVAAVIDELILVVLVGLASWLVACVINFSFLKQERIVLYHLWDSLKNMSAQIAERIVPGPSAGKSAKKTARSQANKQLKARVLSGLDKSRMAGKGTGVAGIDNRLSLAMQRIQDGAKIDMQYLLQLVDLGSCNPDDYVGVPDLWTEIPTGLICVKNAGVLTTSVTGTLAWIVYPSARSEVQMMAGTTDYGIVSGVDPVAERSIGQYASMLSAYQGIRQVAKQIKLRSVANLTTMSGMFASAPIPGQTTISTPTVGLLQSVPMCTTGTMAQVFAEGEVIFDYLPAAATQRTPLVSSDESFSPLDFNRVDRKPVGPVYPSVMFAVSGVTPAAVTPVFEMETLNLFEFTTINVTVPTTAMRPSSPEAVSLGRLASHPLMREHVKKNKGNNTLAGIANHVMDNWDTYKHLGAGAYKTIMHASGLGSKLLGKAATTLGPLALALL